MRHEKIIANDELARTDLSAASWPATAAVAAVPVVEIERATSAAAFSPTPAAPDVPASVGGLIAAAYIGLIGALALATARTADTAFVIAIAALFVAVFLAVPRLFFAVEPRGRTRPSLTRFMHQGLHTYTGHSSGAAALVQMLIVPVCLTLAILAMGAAAAIIM